MLDPPPSAFIAGVQAVPVAALLLFLGYLIADRLLGGRPVDVATRAGLALPALVALCLVFMLGHIASGGAILGNATLVRWILAATGAGLLVSKRFARTHAPKTPPGIALGLVAVVVVTALVWTTPAFRMLPQPYRADIRVHAGRTHQLLNGERLPSAGIVGQVPNDYPWLYHGLLAVITLVTPGERALGALGPLLLVQTCGAALTLFALGRILRDGLAGGLMVLFGSLAGGFGYLLVDGPALTTRADALRYMGDLVVRRSPNGAFHELAPVFPRDVALALLPAFLALLVLGCRDRMPRCLPAAGVALGMMGLIGPDAFVIAFLAVLGLVLFPVGVGRWRIASSVVVTALVLYALWAGPMVYHFVALGSAEGMFSSPVGFTVDAVLFAWGIMTPFAVVGIVRAVPRMRDDVGVRVATTVVLAAIGVLVATVVPLPFFGDAFLTLGYAHRYWPVLYVGLAVFGALGCAWAVGRLAQRSNVAAGAALIAVAAAAVPSPILGSVALPAATAPEPLVHAALTGAPSSVLNLVARRPGTVCRLAVPERLGVPVFAYTGYPLVQHALNPRPDSTNRARIRWDREALGLPTDAQLTIENRILTAGRGSEARFGRLLARYDLDVIVVAPRVASLPRYRSFRAETSRDEGRRWVVLTTGDCSKA